MTNGRSNPGRKRFRLRLARAGYRVDDASRSLENLATAFGTSPERLYRLMAGR